MALPLGLERRYVDDDSAARVRRLSKADRQYVARNTKIFDGARQSERIGRNDADIALQVDERIGIERLRVDDRAVDVGEDLEFGRAANVVAIARRAVADDAFAVNLANLPWFEWLDHAACSHAANPLVALDAHRLRRCGNERAILRSFVDTLAR